MVLFRNGVFLLKEFQRNGQNWPFLFLLDTLTPRRRAPPRRRHLHLSKPEVKFSELSGLPRRSEASLRCTCKLCFSSSLPLILTNIYWINEDPNK